METFNSIDEIRANLGHSFSTGRFGNMKSILVGIIVAKATDKFVKDNLLDNLSYWHHRSDNITDFFFPGYETDLDTKTPPTVTVGERKWWYSANRFATFVNDINGSTDYDYSGKSDFLALPALRRTDSELPDLDFTQSLVIDLELAATHNAMDQPERLFEKLFGLAQDWNEDHQRQNTDIAEALRNREGRRALRQLMNSILPEALSNAVRGSAIYSIRDLKKTGT